MWVEISNDIFETSDFKGLNYLYQLLSWFPNSSQSRHKVFIDFEKVRHTVNYKNLAGFEIKFDEFIESQFDEFITSTSKNKPCPYKVTNLKSKNCFTIEEAIVFFSQPVSIVLENNKNDSFFIVAIINHFDSSKVVIEHLNNGWIAFENAGGCTNVENFLDGFLQRFDKLSLKNNRLRSDYFRGILILDSDREFPTQTTKQESLKKSLREKGIDSVHILEKRMMENYLPDEIYEDLRTEFKGNKNLIDWLQAYLHLSNNDNGQKQKDYLNIKSGFSKELDSKEQRKPQKSEILELYNISESNFVILDKGFSLPNFKNEMPRYFVNSTRINKHTLQNRCKTNELQDILNKIIQLL